MLQSKEIAEILGVKTVTVRKYAKALEDAGYIVSRSDSGHREYTEVDATVFRELQALCEHTGMTVEKAAFAVVARHNKASVSVAPTVVGQDKEEIMQYDPRYEELVNTINNLNDQNLKILEQNERIERRMVEQNENLTLLMKEILETKRMMIAANQKKSWKFWKRDSLGDSTTDPETAWRKKERRMY